MTTWDFQDEDIIASRRTKPTFFEAPYPRWSKVKPDPYQHAAVEYRIARRHGIFGDAPGLGKTAEAILFGNAIQAKKTLVVCPASLRLNWEREIKMWSTIKDVATYVILKSKDGVSLVHDYVVISYDLLRNMDLLEAILDGRWDHLILDEAHALKDPKGNKRTHAICAPNSLPSVVDRISLLTGTLLPSQPIEGYNAMRLVDWEGIDGMSLGAFREHFYEEGKGWIRSPVLVTEDEHGRPCEPYYINKLHFSDSVRNVPRNLVEFQWRLRKFYMVRRRKEDVLTQLPEKQWHLFPLETNATIRKVFQHASWKKVQKLYEIDPDNFNPHIPVEEAISTAMRLLGEAKAPMVADYIEELLKEGVEKIIVGAWHRNPSEEGVAKTKLSVLHYLRDRLNKYGLVYMDGTTTSRKKQEAVDSFQNDENTRIILGQLNPLGEGWTLSKAQDVVLAEFFWVPGRNDQLLDRAHRRGQKGNYVIGHVPVIPGSLDERVISTVVRKDRNIHAATDAIY